MSASSDLRAAEWIADLLDNRLRILGIPVGLDALLGVMPGAGDAVAAVLSGYLVVIAYRRGLPASAINRMVGNILLDFFLGLVPILGDFTDIFFRSNQRNLQILRQHIP